MSGLFKRIDNRLYCDYYTLHKLIHDYIKNQIKDPDVVKKTAMTKAYPVYKSLDLTRVYPIQHTIDMQESIMSAITELENYLITRENVLVNDTKQSNLGLNIDNLVLSQQYSNLLLRERIKMYVQNLETFHGHHTKYFTRLYLKLKLMVGVVNEDISVKTARGIKSKMSVDPLRIDQDGAEDTIAPEEEQSIKNLISVDDVSPETRKALSSALASIPSEPSTDVSEECTGDDVSRPSSAADSFMEMNHENVIVADDNERAREKQELTMMEVEMEEIKLSVSDDGPQDIVVTSTGQLSGEVADMSEEPQSEEPLAEKIVTDEQSDNEEAQTAELSPISP